MALTRSKDQGLAFICQGQGSATYRAYDIRRVGAAAGWETALQLPGDPAPPLVLVSEPLPAFDTFPFRSQGAFSILEV